MQTGPTVKWFRHGLCGVSCLMLPLICFVGFHKVLSLSEPQFSHLCNGVNLITSSKFVWHMVHIMETDCWAHPRYDDSVDLK